jgi:hypothetical protein
VRNCVAGAKWWCSALRKISSSECLDPTGKKRGSGLPVSLPCPRDGIRPLEGHTEDWVSQARRKGTHLFMPNPPSGAPRRFQVLCSATAAAELRESECQDIIRHVVALAQERDRGVHEGLTFAFDLHGKEWKIVVDLVEGWVKILVRANWSRG